MRLGKMTVTYSLFGQFFIGNRLAAYKPGNWLSGSLYLVI